MALKRHPSTTVPPPWDNLSGTVGSGSPVGGGAAKAARTDGEPTPSAIVGDTHDAKGDARPALWTILEQERNNLKQVCQEGTDREQKRNEETEEPRGEAFVRAVAVKCNSWMCEDCKRRRGYDFRQRLLAKAELFKEPRLYTITVKRDWHESPGAAYEYITSGGFIPRLFRLFGIKRWVWVLEPQQETGDGWPHWHVLVDIGDLPGKWYHRELKATAAATPRDTSGWIYVPHFLDLNRAHRLLRKWQVGEQCRLSVRKDSFESPEHAINYLTKYLVKMPKRGYPPWMLKRPRIRFTGSSRPIGRLVAAEKSSTERGDAEEEPETLERRDARPPIERIADCGYQMVFLQYEPAEDRHVLVGRCRAPKIAVEEWAWAATIEDFDFERQETFTVWGFRTAAGAQQFMDTWEGQALQEGVAQHIAARAGRILQGWDASEGAIPGDRHTTEGRDKQNGSARRQSQVPSSPFSA